MASGNKVKTKADKIVNRLYQDAFGKPVRLEVVTTKLMDEYCPFTPAINPEVPKSSRQVQRRVPKVVGVNDVSSPNYVEKEIEGLSGL